MPPSAVITADIVNSTSMPPARYKQLTGQIRQVLQGQQFEFYRGDSFQIYLRDPRIALNIVLRLRALARSYNFIHDVRAGIGIGEVPRPVRTIRTATSEAFVLSGRAFEKLSDEQRLLIESDSSIINVALSAIAGWTDYLCLGLTSKQAEVINELLQEETQTEIARKLKKAQPTINGLAEAAGWKQFERLLELYQESLKEIK